MTTEMTTDTTDATPLAVPGASTKMGAIFAALLKRASVPLHDPQRVLGVAVGTLAVDAGVAPGYASAQLCALRQRGLVQTVTRGRVLPTDAGIAAAQAVYGPNLEGLGWGRDGEG